MFCVEKRYIPNFYGYRTHLDSNIKNKPENIIIENDNVQNDSFYNAYCTFPQEDVTPELKGKYKYIIVPKSVKHDVTLIDSGNHRKNIHHLLKALTDEARISTVEVKLVDKAKDNPKLEAQKDLKDLDIKLKEINNSQTKPEYILIPALSTVPLLNLSDRIRSVLGIDVRLTPENIKENKEIVLNFLQRIAEDPQKYRGEINHMDTDNEGYENLFSVINEINKCVDSGVNVLVPAGHPHHTNLDYLFKTNKLKTEYYRYIATGDDINGSVNNLKNQCQKDNWYDFNLLSLSNAHSVGISKNDGTKFFHTAYDSCVTDYALGAFNFSPIRKNGKVEGYSFTDEKTIQYSKEEFNEASDIEKFVGLNINDVLANDPEHEALRNIVQQNHSADDIQNFIDANSNKLFKINKIFDEKAIQENKMEYLGKYIDVTLKYNFDTNDENKVLFQKCNVEGSQRPSLHSFWGTCYSSAAKTAHDIKNKKPNYRDLSNVEEFKNQYYENLIKKAQSSFGREKEENLIEALRTKQESVGADNPSLIHDNIRLGDFYKKETDDRESAQKYYENALRISLLNFHPRSKTNADCYFKLGQFHCICENTNKTEENINNAIDIYAYTDPENKNIALGFNLIANALERSNKDNKTINAQICRNAANAIENGAKEKEQILKLRAEGTRKITIG